jgi:hypothetical protein
VASAVLLHGGVAGNSLRSGNGPSPSMRKSRAPVTAPRPRRPLRSDAEHRPVRHRRTRRRQSARPGVPDNLIRGAFLGAILLAAIWLLFGSLPS